MTDPASLNVSVSFTGLSSDEFRALLRHLSGGARFTGTASQPAIGGLRYQVSVHDLSIGGAAHLTDGLFKYLDDVALEPLADWERELLEKQAAQHTEKETT